ncbi:MAG: hypothetical protein ACKO32_03985, partial [Planctomycetia bacterium]
CRQAHEKDGQDHSGYPLSVGILRELFRTVQTSMRTPADLTPLGVLLQCPADAAACRLLPVSGDPHPEHVLPRKGTP